MKSILPIAFAALVLTGCFDQKAWIERFAPKDDDQFARQFLDSVRQARYDDAKRMLGPGVLAQAGPDGLSQLHGILDQGEPIAVELIAVNTSFFKPWSGAPAKHESNLSLPIGIQRRLGAGGLRDRKQWPGSEDFWREFSASNQLTGGD